MLLTFAPMEGLTGVVFRRCHHRFFGGPDLYYMPFVTPTREPRFTERQLRDIAPESNEGVPVVPQLLTQSPENFRWAALSLASMGYREVNLNLGCPMGTVTAKGKGSGMLRDPFALESFFEKVFSAPLPVAVSVKTRLGWRNEDEFEDLLRVYNRFPISEVIVHARVREDFYKGDARRGAFARFLPGFAHRAGYNGDIVTTRELGELRDAFPNLRSVMVGRAAVANPAFFRMARGGPACTRKELFAFHRALFEELSEAFGSVGNTVGHMKQYWFYMRTLFEGGDRIFKKLLKTRRAADYMAVVSEIEETLPLQPEAKPLWWKPSGDPRCEP
ncbi:tRNA-dihydrouridine synthase [Mesosutterella sp. AGMB02718]|uniref:tRNA-dihydrouridine synthase n=1 Tax=Mesosutterella faecium TaxID=2925194 RepID=A0ABT7IN42_9BURK|nr:tRNA-dihydrouridine synthase [Mesosutterella sp. AGMB02718]MDL2059799.1 tRNA-dihydrouridine synthase [Mesosutterella sp. AGMB02718]